MTAACRICNRPSPHGGPTCGNSYCQEAEDAACAARNARQKDREALWKRARELVGVAVAHFDRRAARGVVYP